MLLETGRLNKNIAGRALLPRFHQLLHRAPETILSGTTSVYLVRVSIRPILEGLVVNNESDVRPPIAAYGLYYGLTVPAVGYAVGRKCLTFPEEAERKVG
jgi:hypothetical protein